MKRSIKICIFMFFVVSLLCGCEGVAILYDEMDVATQVISITVPDGYNSINNIIVQKNASNLRAVIYTEEDTSKDENARKVNSYNYKLGDDEVSKCSDIDSNGVSFYFNASEDTTLKIYTYSKSKCEGDKYTASYIITVTEPTVTDPTDTDPTDTDITVTNPPIGAGTLTEAVIDKINDMKSIKNKYQPIPKAPGSKAKYVIDPSEFTTSAKYKTQNICTGINDSKGNTVINLNDDNTTVGNIAACLAYVLIDKSAPDCWQFARAMYFAASGGQIDYLGTNAVGKDPGNIHLSNNSRWTEVTSCSAGDVAQFFDSDNIHQHTGIALSKDKIISGNISGGYIKIQNISDYTKEGYTRRCFRIK